MSHIQYTICRSGTYYYNRRVPKQAIAAYGSFIRHALSSDFEEASAYAECPRRGLGRQGEDYTC